MSDEESVSGPAHGALTRAGLPALWRHDPERLWEILRWVVPPFSRAIAPGYAYGVGRVPTTGGAVVASNHFGTIDPPLVGSYATRTIYFMSKDELVDMPWFGELIRWTGAFSVRRGEGDRDAIRLARWLVREGHIVGMFAEGTRQPFGYPGPTHSGTLMIAMKENVPLVPCGIDTFGWRMNRRRRCCLVWGKPLMLDDLPRNARGYKVGAERLDAALLALWRQAAQAVVDGFPPQLADGTPRAPAQMPWRAHYPRIRPWPAEPWAVGPLGVIFRPEKWRREPEDPSAGRDVDDRQHDAAEREAV